MSDKNFMTHLEMKLSVPDLGRHDTVTLVEHDGEHPWERWWDGWHRQEDTSHGG